MHLINVLLTTENLYPSQIGGPSNTIYWHAKALVNENLKVSTIATSQGIDPKHKIPIGKWVNFNYGEVIYCKSRFSAFIEVLKTYHKYDIIHLSSLFYYPSILVAIYSYFRGKKLVWSPRGECSNSALKFSSWKKKPILKIVKAVSKNVLFHSTSKKETADIRQVFGNVQIVEIQNFLYLEKRLLVPVKQQLLFMGRIHPIKALENLIRAFYISDKNLMHNFTLQIVGSSKGQEDYRSKLNKLVEELNLVQRIEFVEHIEGETKTIKLSESYCLILPSHSENFGNVVIEALNQGTPVIASKNTPWEILEAYSAGYHVSNDPVDIANAIISIINTNNSDYLALRDNAYNLCKDKFSINNNIGKWITIYNSI